MYISSMNKTEEYISKINVSTFNGTICLSEKEFERHLSMFAYQRVIEFMKWDDIWRDVRRVISFDEVYNNFLKEEEHQRTTK